MRMMRFLYWPTCPYACKVTGVLAATGLESHVEKIPMHPWEANTPIPEHNPLGKIPALIDEFGDTFYDSRVICEYLDHRHKGNKLIPVPSSNKRWEVLTLQASADGINDAATLKLTEENVRPAHLRSTKWVNKQRLVIEKALDELEKRAPTFRNESINLGLLAVSAALGYLTYRYGSKSWRGTHPRLSTWHASVMDQPIYAATLPVESIPLPEIMESLNE